MHIYVPDFSENQGLKDLYLDKHFQEESVRNNKYLYGSNIYDLNYIYTF